MSLLPCFGRRPPKATGAPTPPKGQSGRGDLSHFLSNPRKVHSCTVTLDAHTPQLVGILLGGEPGVQRHPGTILPSPAPRVSTLRTSTGGVRAPSKHFNQSNATSPFAPPGARSLAYGLQYFSKDSTPRSYTHEALLGGEKTHRAPSEFRLRKDIPCLDQLPFIS